MHPSSTIYGHAQQLRCADHTIFTSGHKLRRDRVCPSKPAMRKMEAYLQDTIASGGDPVLIRPGGTGSEAKLEYFKKRNSRQELVGVVSKSQSKR